jgi:hypothetical protein
VSNHKLPAAFEAGAEVVELSVLIAAKIVFNSVLKALNPMLLNV